MELMITLVITGIIIGLISSNLNGLKKLASRFNEQAVFREQYLIFLLKFEEDYQAGDLQFEKGITLLDSLNFQSDLNMDGDLGRHLTIGNFILDSGTIPTRDIFSHTMQGLQLTPHEWLAQVAFALAFRVAGLNGVVIFCALLIAVTFTLVYRQCLCQSKILLVSLGLTIFASAAASIHWLARPHLFTLLFSVIWIGELEKWRITISWHFMKL